MLIVCYLDLFITSNCLEFTRIIFNLLTLYSNLRFTYFYVIFNFSLREIYFASRAVNLNFIVKLHDYSVRLFEVVRCFTMRTGKRSLYFLWCFPWFDAVVTKEFLTRLTFFWVSNYIHTYNTIEFILHFCFCCKMRWGIQQLQEFFVDIIGLLLYFLFFFGIVSCAHWV